MSGSIRGLAANIIESCSTRTDAAAWITHRHVRASRNSSELDGTEVPLSSHRALCSFIAGDSIALSYVFVSMRIRSVALSRSWMHQRTDWSPRRDPFLRGCYDERENNVRSSKRSIGSLIFVLFFLLFAQLILVKIFLRIFMWIETFFKNIEKVHVFS